MAVILATLCLYYIIFHNHAEHVKIYGVPNTAEYLARRESKHHKPIVKLENFIEDILLILFRDERANRYCGPVTIGLLVVVFVAVVV